MQKLRLGIFRFALVLLAVIAAGGAWAASRSSSDDYIAQVWDADSGLPQSTVTSIVQTPDGYLWVGTMHGGLARFDGEHFVNFQPGNTPQLESIEIMNLFVDSQGTLWVHTVEGGLISYRDGKFHPEYFNSQIPASWLRGILSEKPGILRFYSRSGMILSRITDSRTNHWETFVPQGDATIATICEDANGLVWCRTKNGTVAQIHDGNMVKCPTPPQLGDSGANTLVKDSAGRIWIGTKKGIARWNNNGFEDMTPTNGEPIVNVEELFPCANGGLWVQTSGRLRKCQARKWEAEAKLRDEDHNKPGSHKNFFASLSSPFPDSSGGIWLAHYQRGLAHVRPDGQVSWVRDSESLVTGPVHCWYEDHEGNVWVALSDGGLARLRRRTFHPVWPADEAESKVACSVCEDENGVMLFGTAGKTVLSWDYNTFSATNQPVDSSRETKVLPGGGGRLWIGSVHGGLMELTSQGFQRPFPSDAIAGVVRCFYQDRRGALWIGSEFGLFRWEKGMLKTFSTNDGFSPAYVLSFAEDKTGGIWFGTALGELRCFSDGKFKTFLPPDSLTDKAALDAEATADQFNSRNLGALSGGERFWSLHLDSEGVLWIGTLGGGLLRFDGGKFTRFTKADGLPGNDINQILEDSHGCLWLGTSAGVVRVSKDQLNSSAEGSKASIVFACYDKSDGLPTLECYGGTQPNCWRSRDGRLWFTTLKGAVWVDPTEPAPVRVAPQIHLEEFWLDGKRQDEKGFPASQPAANPPTRMSVSAGQHYYEFKFCAPSLAAPDKVKFKWRLAKLDRDWVDGGGHDSANYSFIPPGDYRFEVLARNNDGVWSSAPAVMDLTVLPYFWQRWWFKVTIGLCLLAGLVTIYVVKVSRMRMLEHLRVRIARDLHDEVGSNLGSIALLAKIMEKKPSSTDAALVSGIAEQTIETLRDIIWFIDPTHNNLNDLVLRLQETSQMMLAAVPHKFEQNGEFRPTDLSLSFRRNVPAIFKETLHNVVKHSHATEVAITVSYVEKKFQFRVQDNGVGFCPETKTAGNGLKNMRKRANEINAQLMIESVPGNGTVTTLSVNVAA